MGGNGKEGKGRVWVKVRCEIRERGMGGVEWLSLASKELYVCLLRGLSLTYAFTNHFRHHSPTCHCHYYPLSYLCHYHSPTYTYCCQYHSISHPCHPHSPRKHSLTLAFSTTCRFAPTCTISFANPPTLTTPGASPKSTNSAHRSS